MNIIIQYDGDSERDDFEFFEKGYRYVTVLVDGLEYRLFIVTFPRLYQEFIDEIENTGLYLVEPNTILVKEITRNEIEKTIKKMCEIGAFHNLGSNLTVELVRKDYSNVVEPKPGLKIVYGGKQYEKQGLAEGFREDVLVLLKNKEYKMHVTNIARLYYDYMVDIERKGIFCPQYNLLIVKEAHSSIITDVITSVFNEGFFDKLGYTL